MKVPTRRWAVLALLGSLAGCGIGAACRKAPVPRREWR
jgi:hypothetical protein